MPTIPSGFLQLSGISSLGYLGGKLARKPGPVISSMDKATYDKGSLTLVINGSNLSKDATFKIQKDSNEFITSPKDVSVTTEIINPEAGDSSLAKILKIIIPSTENNWIKSKQTPYKLTIYNPDGQFAEWQFDGTEVPAVVEASGKPKIQSIDPSTVPANQEIALTVKGTNFIENSKVSIKDNEQKDITIKSSEFKSAEEITVTVTMSGTSSYKATLTITNSGDAFSEPYFFDVSSSN